jgi:hypothetical protein
VGSLLGSIKKFHVDQTGYWDNYLPNSSWKHVSQLTLKNKVFKTIILLSVDLVGIASDHGAASSVVLNQG